MVEEPDRTWRLIRAVFHACLGALLVVYIAFFSIKCIADIRCPYALDYGEGLVLSQALRLTQGETLYNDYTHYPYVVSNYPPLFIALSAVGVKLFGVSFAFGRALAFAAMLGVAVMMAVLLRRGRVGLVPALGAPAFLLSTSAVAKWSGFMRVDTTALLLVMAGLYFVLKGGKWLIAAVILMLAASYTKQSMVAGVAAAFVYLLWIGGRKSALLFLGSWVGIGLAVFGLFQAVSGGWFYRHVVVGNANPWYWDQTWWWIRETGKEWPVLLSLAAVSAVVVAAGLRRGSGRAAPAKDPAMGDRLFLPYFVFAAASFLTVGKAGATVNYVIEPLAAACMVAALGYDRLLRARPTRVAHPLWVVAALALAGQAIAMWAPPWRWEAQRNLQAEGARAAAQIIAKTKGDIIGEPVGILVTSGRPVLLDPASFSQMSLAGVWDATPLLRDIRSRRFALIFVSSDALWGLYEHGSWGYARWSGPMMQAIRTHYRLVGRTGNTCFFRRAYYGSLHPLDSGVERASPGAEPDKAAARTAPPSKSARHRRSSAPASGIPPARR